nr:signaling protein wnt4 precursor [Schistosoma japonicum]
MNLTQLEQTIQDMNNNDSNNIMTSETFVGADGKLQMSICDHPNGFLRRQKKLCRQYLHLMESVIRGYFMGLKECEYQFSAHRWNCQGHNLTIQAPTSRKQKRLRYRESELKNDMDNSRRKSVRIQTYLDKLLSKGTRESAYVLAVTSAGVSHAVTKACSSGLHDNCGCDRTIYDHPREPNFEWSGCSDNIHFGAAFSRQFLDVRERNRLKRNPKLGLTNLHNNHVGRHMVINKMEVQCKCHGVSGSCEMRTCWRSLPKFRHLGAQLQERFHEAIQVTYIQNRLVSMKALEQLSKESNGNALLLSHSALLSSVVSGVSSSDELPASPRINRNAFDTLTRSTSLTTSPLPSPTENDLIYISESPTFCHHDPRYGSIGTYGRQCDENSQGLNSCNYLCCGRGFKRQTFVQQERCDCKFQWCCKVVCKTCRKTVVISTCN